jgi:hypothetical protein
VLKSYVIIAYCSHSPGVDKIVDHGKQQFHFQCSSLQTVSVKKDHFNPFSGMNVSLKINKATSVFEPTVICAGFGKNKKTH